MKPNMSWAKRHDNMREWRGAFLWPAFWILWCGFFGTRAVIQLAENDWTGIYWFLASCHALCFAIYIYIAINLLRHKPMTYWTYMQHRGAYVHGPYSKRAAIRLVKEYNEFIKENPSDDAEKNVTADYVRAEDQVDAMFFAWKKMGFFSPKYHNVSTF